MPWKLLLFMSIFLIVFSDNSTPPFSDNSTPPLNLKSNRKSIVEELIENNTILTSNCVVRFDTAITIHSTSQYFKTAVSSLFLAGKNNTRRIFESISPTNINKCEYMHIKSIDLFQNDTQTNVSHAMLHITNKYSIDLFIYIIEPLKEDTRGFLITAGDIACVSITTILSSSHIEWALMDGTGEAAYSDASHM